MLNVGLLGCGTVGSGVIKLLQKNAEIVAKRTGSEIVIKKVLEKDTGKCLEAGVSEEMVAGSYEEILNDESIDIVVELIGGLDPAFDFITRAMNKGKHVVTAN
ncbi:MAG TPA: homoserine dehydrogenase, partial [Syntrophomonas sp.]|nr:homoserine dehydrogenase [Syntrophomonas sp.]